MSTTLTFDQMERSADRTLAVVLWAKHVKYVTEGVVLFAFLNQLLRSLVRGLSADDKLNSLSEDQIKELTSTLREIHEGLLQVLEHNAMCLLKRKVLFKGSIASIEERAEDLSDIIENLVLSCNSDFRAIVADCVTSISSAHSAEPVARM